MPELPEVEALAGFLTEKTAGRTIEQARALAISALKTFDPPLEALEGRTFTEWSRKGKFLLGDTGDLYLVLHLARAGWVRWYDAIKAGPGRPQRGSPVALRVRLDDGTGFEATEMGTEKRLQVHVVRDPMDVAHVATLGIDPLDPAFDAAALARLLRERKAQIKGVLTDQTVIAGVGNAYSDEALHIAKLSPFKNASTLTAAEVDALHRALVGVLSDAVQRSVGLQAKGLKSEKKSGLRVHGRAGEACPECGDTVREVSFATKALQYCPACQTGGRPLADRRLSKLLK